jgi:hypothetical protein
VFNVSLSEECRPNSELKLGDPEPYAVGVDAGLIFWDIVE